MSAHLPHVDTSRPTASLNCGVYRHWRGGRYTLVLVAETHLHNGDLDVVYVSHTTGSIVTRPLQRDSRDQESWNDVVAWPDMKLRRRFEPDTPELSALFEES